METPKSHEIQRSPQEIKDVLLHGGMLMVDLDDTVKEAFKFEWPDRVKRRVLPETIDAFKKAHAAGIPIGIATEQSFTEIAPFLMDVTKLVLGEDHTDPYELFNGLIIGEGGSIVRPAGNASEPRIVAPEGAMEDRAKILAWIEGNLQDTNVEGWKTLPGVNPEDATYVQLPPTEDQAVATLSLWEKGPHVTEDPAYVHKYKMIEDRLNLALQELGITTLKVYEAGNGTVRIVPRTASKAHTMELLAGLGLIDRSKIVYACDGPNDVALARQLKAKGGSVIAVGNAVGEIKAVADIKATQTAGLGFAEAIGMILDENNGELEDEASLLFRTRRLFRSFFS